MSSTSHPPFKVGQRVVAIKNHVCLKYKKDDIRVVLAIKEKECSCGGYLIDIGVPTSGGDRICNICDFSAPSDGKIWWMNAINFAPIETQYSDATADILEKYPITEERPDKVLSPEIVNN